MVLKMYSVRDSKAEVFHPPMYAHTHGEAERNFTTAVRADPTKSNIAAFPEDYDLYHVGEFDDQTGKIIVLDTPQHMSKAIQFVERTALKSV